MESILKVRSATKKFGGLIALENVDLHVNPGEVLGVIGPNGSGKTTLFNIITGLYPLTSGKVFYKNEDITGLSLFETARRGIVRTFQSTEIFKDFNVLDNIKGGGYHRIRTGILGKLFRTKKRKIQEHALEAHSNEILKFMGIWEWKDVISSNLPYGIQRLLGISIALAANPTLLLLDEPTTGMNQSEKAHFIGLINEIRQKGITIAIVEHDMKVIMGISDRMIVLSNGRRIAEGFPEDIRRDKQVIDVYLGAEVENT